MSEAFRAAAESAKKRADREGVTVTHMVWRDGHLECTYEKRPKT